MHDWYRLFLVEDGIHTLDLPTGRVACSSGALYLSQPGRVLPGYASPGARAVLLDFTVMACRLQRDADKRAAQTFRPEPGQRQPDAASVWGVDLPVVLAERLGGRLASIVRGIAATWWLSDRDHFAANRRLARLLDDIYGHYVDRRGNPSVNPWRSHWLQSILPEIEELLPSLHTVEDLAVLAGVSTTHLHREFRRTVGETPGGYLRRRRRERAADLLCETDLPVHQVAEMVGYSSQSAFNNAWRGWYPVSPIKWRRMVR